MINKDYVQIAMNEIDTNQAIDQQMSQRDY
jgi:hypothetical protein